MRLCPPAFLLFKSANYVEAIHYVSSSFSCIRPCGSKSALTFENLESTAMRQRRNIEKPLPPTRIVDEKKILKPFVPLPLFSDQETTTYTKNQSQCLHLPFSRRRRADVCSPQHSFTIFSSLGILSFLLSLSLSPILPTLDQSIPPLSLQNINIKRKKKKERKFHRKFQY